jgi:hypothetical protein
MINHNEMAKICHERAKAKGWWEKPRSDAELLMLIITELAEATEEARASKPPVYFNTTEEVTAIADPKGLMKLWVDNVMQKPEGELIELADAMIRLYDMAGAREVVLDTSWMKSETRYASALCAHFSLCEVLCNSNESLSSRMSWFVSDCEAYCHLKGWDLEKAIHAKMEYNETRAHRHGGKAF